MQQNINPPVKPSVFARATRAMLAHAATVVLPTLIEIADNLEKVEAEKAQCAAEKEPQDTKLPVKPSVFVRKVCAGLGQMTTAVLSALGEIADKLEREETEEAQRTAEEEPPCPR